MFNLDGKVIIITGGAGFLGEKHAEAIAQYGGTPVLLDLDQDRIEEVTSKIKDLYSITSIGISVDITNEQKINSAVSKILKKFSKIDGLINNAAVNPKVDLNQESNFSRLEHFPIETWSQEINVGLTGAFLSSKIIGPIIANNPSGGSIINISSDLGIIAPNQSLYLVNGLRSDQQPVKPITYSVIKSGLIGLSRYLSTYWPTLVRSNVICPGGIENNQDDDFKERIQSLIPMGRMGKSTELQGAVVFLLSDASSYINGAVLSVDGGRTALVVTDCF